ncbi:MAG: precorrin-8X methylmutase, partial [Angelakisella sp.]
KHTLPADIERTSMSIITAELAARNIDLEEASAPIIKRVIHTTADFDYAKSLRFTQDAVAKGVAALGRGAHIVTDTNMTKAGISEPSLARLAGHVHCFMADTDVKNDARQNGTTRAVASMDKAYEHFPDALLVVGNAPTALLHIVELMEKGLRPPMVIAVPVGFVNVVESKEKLFAACEEYGVPAIVAMGRKGGSNIAAAICNALLYIATDTLDPTERGWK